MRKLVTIRTIASVSPIPDADAIEVARVDGWDVVVKKGEFKPGDPCVYFEIDSYLPIEEKYEFLRKSSYRKIHETGQEGFRLKTARMRGQVSQGLALPLSAFPELLGLDQGADVTELLKVEKWEPPVPACLSGDVHGRMSSYVPITDQERIQNLFNKFANDPVSLEMEWEATIKLDGASMSVYLDPETSEFCVCGRNYSLKESPASSYWQAARAAELEEVLRGIPVREGIPEIALQGELVGPGIQENNEKLKKCEFRLFDAYNMKAARYFTPDERNLLATVHGVKHVPVVGRFKGSEIFTLGVDGILKMADGPSMNPQSKREGLVFKRADGKASFKAISNIYLLKNGG